MVASGTNIVIGAGSLGGRISVKCAGEEVGGGVSGDAFHGNAPTDVPPTVRETGYLKVASVLPLPCFRCFRVSRFLSD